MEMEEKVSKRTGQQNRALHLYFRLVADALNSAGLTIQETLKHQMDIEWNEYRVKELIWRQAQKKYLGKASTVELNKVQEIDELYDHVNRYLGTLGVENIPFPTKEQLNALDPSFIANNEPINRISPWRRKITN